MSRRGGITREFVVWCKEEHCKAWLLATVDLYSRRAHAKKAGWQREEGTNTYTCPHHPGEMMAPDQGEE